jgi:ribonuclease-3 family protein
LPTKELPSSQALAFLGDAVHSLYVRRLLVSRGLAKSGALNDAARPLVSAEGQARQAARVLPHLTEYETDVYRRAFNSGHLNRPKHASGADYRAATGWEAVLGMLTYTEQNDRADALLALALTEEEEKTNDSED